MAEKFKRGEHPHRLRRVCPEDGIKRNKNTRDRQTDRQIDIGLFFSSRNVSGKYKGRMTYKEGARKLRSKIMLQWRFLKGEERKGRN